MLPAVERRCCATVSLRVVGMRVVVQAEGKETRGGRGGDEECGRGEVGVSKSGRGEGVGETEQF